MEGPIYYVSHAINRRRQAKLVKLEKDFLSRREKKVIIHSYAYIFVR